MNFIYSDTNSQAIEDLLTSDEDIKCAVAFWGCNAIDLLANTPKTTKIICNLESGATNPFVIESLIKQGIQVKTNKKLHAKVYLAKNKQAIVGSANASANGLSYEDSEVQGWLEAGILVEDKQTLLEINNWFSTQWNAADDITKPLIENTKTLWKKKRNVRKLDAQEGSLLDCLRNTPEQLKDKNIFITIYRNKNAAEEAHNKFIEVQKLNINKRLTFWEDWSNLPENSEFISLYYGPNKGFTFERYYKTRSPASDYIEAFNYNDGSTGEILICFLKNSINGMILTEDDQLILRNRIEALWQQSPNRQPNDTAICISLYEARTIIFPDRA